MSAPSESELRRDLYQLNLPVGEIAEKHNCHRKTVWKKRTNFNLPKLPKLGVTERNGSRRYYASGEKEFAEYQLVAIADGADPHDVFGDSHVHHINGCQYDNRPENLVTLTPEEHTLVEKGVLELDVEQGILYRELEYDT